MTYSHISIKRSFVLGEIYKQCESIACIPVYLNDPSGEPLGYADESLGHYADAFVFNLPENICKKISANHYSYSLGFDYFERSVKTVEKKRIKLNHILLVEKKPLFGKKSIAQIRMKHSIPTG